MDNSTPGAAPATMRAMLLEEPGRPLTAAELPLPAPGPGQALIRVSACAVCRTDLHIADGELPFPGHPVILGHEIVGTVEALGPGTSGLETGTRIGVPWLGHTCGRCGFCRSGQENLCYEARFPCSHLAGGFAEYTVADLRYCFPLPDGYGDTAAAPLLCAGLIGYRALRMAGDGKRLGLYGFGAAAHILTQIAVHQGREVYAFTRPGKTRAQRFARDLGATWAGGTDDPPPNPLDAAIIFAPAGFLVRTALAAVRKGGTVVCAGIHMSDIPPLPYSLLWGERRIVSVANLTRADGLDFFAVAPAVPVRTRVTTFSLEQANTALDRVRRGALEGAAVLAVGQATHRGPSRQGQD